MRMHKGLIVGLGLLGMASAAQAEPMTLSASQMDEVTAGALANIKLNLNITTQVSTPVAISNVVCAVCKNPRIRSRAIAIGPNFNRTFQF